MLFVIGVTMPAVHEQVVLLRCNENPSPESSVTVGVDYDQNKLAIRENLDDTYDLRLRKQRSSMEILETLRQKL